MHVDSCDLASTSKIGARSKVEGCVCNSSYYRAIEPREPDMEECLLCEDPERCSAAPVDVKLEVKVPWHSGTRRDFIVFVQDLWNKVVATVWDFYY